MTMTWQHLPSDVLVCIFSFLEPSYALILINRDTQKLSAQWLPVHFRTQFGLYLAKANAGLYLSFYAKHIKSLLILECAKEINMIVRFQCDNSRRTLCIPPTNNSYYRLVVHQFCDLLNLAHSSIETGSKEVYMCEKCGSRKWSRECWSGYDSEDDMVCDECQYKRTWRNSILEKKITTHKMIMIRKEPSKRALKRKRLATVM